MGHYDEQYEAQRIYDDARLAQMARRDNRIAREFANAPISSFVSNVRKDDKAFVNGLVPLPTVD